MSSILGLYERVFEEIMVEKTATAVSNPLAEFITENV